MSSDRNHLVGEGSLRSEESRRTGRGVAFSADKEACSRGGVEGKTRIPPVEVYVLRSLGVLRKYSGLLDIIFSTIGCRNRPER